MKYLLVVMSYLYFISAPKYCLCDFIIAIRSRSPALSEELNKQKMDLWQIQFIYQAFHNCDTRQDHK